MTSFDQPYASQRSPVCAENVVCTSQPLATEAGINALRKGGNAVDAALAAGITLTVVEPCNNGIGSDTFAIIAQDDELYGLNASGRAPAGWTPERFAGREKMPVWGWDTVTVPGAVSAWVALSERFGQLPFEELFVDAIRYARDGFQVGPITAQVWRYAEKTYAKFPEFVEHFLPVPKAGQRFHRPDMVATLEDIATTKGESFYRGQLAERIADAAQQQGGAMTLDDLANHHADWVTPLAQAYRHVNLHEIPPNGQGLAALIALGILNHHELELDTADSIHCQIEAMKIAIRAAFDHISDIDAMQTGIDALLDADSLRKAAASITAKAAPLPPVELPVSHDTVYLCAADASGLMVSYIQSNYKGFGSGIVIPGTGIAMQNRGHGFSLQDCHPNQVGPGKRPYHTIIPGFVSESGAARMAFGVMGGHMQHQGHVQMVHRIFDHQQNPQAASDAPRWIVNEDFTVGLETAMPASIKEDLAQRGHNVRYVPQTGTFGGAQLILRTADGYVAGSDHRKEGHAAGF